MAINVSGTTNFATQIASALAIIENALLQCEISGEQITSEKVEAGIFGLNLILQQWANGTRGRGSLMLTTVQKCAFQLYNGQASYILPDGTIELLEFTGINLTRLLNGTPYSSAGGNAANAFSNGSGSCLQTAPNGYIAYTWKTPNPIGFVGITSAVTTDYSIRIDYTFGDATADNSEWVTALDTYKNRYTQGLPLWWVIPVPIGVLSLRIKEYGGATLNISNLQYSVLSPNIGRIFLSPISRDTWMQSATATTSQSGSSYYFDPAMPPNVSLYPTPNFTVSGTQNSFTHCFYTRKRQIYDVTQLNQAIDIRQIFFKPLVSALAAYLAITYAPQKVAALQKIADDDFYLASGEDTSNAPFCINITKRR